MIFFFFFFCSKVEREGRESRFARWFDCFDAIKSPCFFSFLSFSLSLPPLTRLDDLPVRRHVVQRVGPVLLDPGRRRGRGRGASEGICRRSGGGVGSGVGGSLALGERFRGCCCRGRSSGVRSGRRGVHHVGVGHLLFETREAKGNDEREGVASSFSKNGKTDAKCLAFFFFHSQSCFSSFLCFFFFKTSQA